MSSNKRDITVDWRLFSLAYKNGELDSGDQQAAGTGQHSAGYNHLPSHRVERVMLAASRQGAKLLDLYTAFGIRHFLSGDDYTDEIIAEVLESLKLDKALAASADDTSLDKELIASSQSALKAVGSDIGVPTIVFKSDDGTEKGFFGPVLKELPDQEQSVKLWDAIAELAQHDGFYELKRGRNGDPDVYSTAKC